MEEFFVRKSIKNIVIICISIVSLISAVLSSVIIDTKAIYSIAYEEQNAKISTSLREEMGSLSSDEEVYVYVWSKDIKEETVLEKLKQSYPKEYSAYVKYSEMTFSESDIAFANDMLNVNEVASDMQNLNVNNKNISEVEIEKVSELLTSSLEHKRELYKEAYISHNNEIADKYPEAKVIFQSSYAPMHIMKVNKSTINKMSKNGSIEQISLYVDMKAENMIADSNDNSGVTYIRQLYDGTDIKIGQIEVGVPDTSHSDLKDKGIVVKHVISTNAYVDHATKVARILVGKSNGVAPGAKLYATDCLTAYDYYKGMEWLIDNGVRVINASFGFESSAGKYNEVDKWTDHIAVEHHVHVVVSAGNNKDYVTSPGMAYNAITVGGYNDNNTASHADDYKPVNSCYKEAVGAAEKPNLVASSENIKLSKNENSDSGTSYAAPQVAGVVAILCSYKPSYIFNQAKMAAVIMAGAEYKTYGSNGGKRGGKFTAYKLSESDWISDYEGAGKLNAHISKEIMQHSTTYDIEISSNSSSYEKTLSLGSIFKSARVVIFWNKKNMLNSEKMPINMVETKLPDFDLYVYNSNGKLLGKSTCKYSNFEIVDVVAGLNSPIKIKIVPKSDFSFSNYKIAMAVHRYK